MAILLARRQLRSAPLASVIDRFYEAAVETALWREVLHEFSMAVGAEGSLLFFHGNKSRRLFSCSEGLDSSMPSYFSGNWHIRNEVIRRGVSQAVAGPLVQTEWTLFDPDEYRRDPFFNEFLRPQGFAWFAGLFISSPRDGLVALSPQRRLHDNPFTPDERDQIAMLVPHFRRARQLARALGPAPPRGALAGH